MAWTLYATAIHEAVGRGELEELKSLESQAEEHLGEAGDVRAALEVLKSEIAKLEAGSGTSA
jgi:hypothetical protein